MNVAVDEDEWIMIDTIHRGMFTIGIVYRLFHYSHFAIDRDVYDWFSSSDGTYRRGCW